MGSGCSSDRLVEEEFFSSGCDSLWGNKMDLEEHFLKFLDVGSTDALTTYTQGMMAASLDKFPDYTKQVITLFGGLTAIPHVFGIGAFFMFLFLDSILNNVKRGPNFESVLQKVFAQEKVSEIRDLMEVYRRRWKASVRDTQRLVAETADYEKKLHEQLVRVRNSMLEDGQLNTRALKIWMQGAMLHVHMHIYLAALQVLMGPGATRPISAHINEYIMDGEVLLDKYQPFQRDQIRLHFAGGTCGGYYGVGSCSFKIDYISSSEYEQTIKGAQGSMFDISCSSNIEDSFVRMMRAKCPAHQTFINYLHRTQDNLNALVRDRGTFWIQ